MLTHHDFPVYSTGTMQRVTIRSTPLHAKTPIQEIAIFDTVDFGKCLVLDGVMQSAESDHALYDNALLDEASSSDTDLLILGGGDGWVAEAALYRAPKAKITVLEIDSVVVAAARREFQVAAFENPRVELLIGDALAQVEQWAQSSAERFDGIAVDLTDNPTGARYPDGFEEFHRRILDASVGTLKKTGWLSMQAGAAHAKPPWRDAAGFLEIEIRKRFRNVRRTDVAIPSFGEKIAFLYARSNAGWEGEALSEPNYMDSDGASPSRS